MSRPVLPPVAIEYPESDGKPMAENDPQLHAIHYAFGALLLRYAARDDVYVSADLLVYYEEGNPRVSLVPDVFVVLGVEDRKRGNYKVWEEGKGPDFVLHAHGRHASGAVLEIVRGALNLHGPRHQPSPGARFGDGQPNDHEYRIDLEWLGADQLHRGVSH